MTTEGTICHRCGATVESGARFCQDCGATVRQGAPAASPPTPPPVYAAPQPRPPAPSQIQVAAPPGAPIAAGRPPNSTVVIGLIAVIAIAAAAYFLVLKKDDSGGSSSGALSSEAVTLVDLTARPPQGWQSVTEEPDTLLFALNEEDLAADQPKGPRVRIIRYEEAALDFHDIVRSGLDDDDKQDRMRNEDRYGRDKKLLGSDLRAVIKTDGEADIVQRHLYLRSGNVFGPAYDIVFQVPASMESKHSGTFNAFLAALEFKPEE